MTLGYTKRGLIDAVKAAKANPNLTIVLRGFGHYDKTSAEYLRWFRGCLNEKINRNEMRKGRKFSRDYEIGLILDARVIREKAFSGRNLLRTPELKRRFPHLDNRMIAD